MADKEPHKHLTVELNYSLREGLEVLRGKTPCAAYIRDIIRATRDNAAEDRWLLRVTDGPVLYKEQSFDEADDASEAAHAAITQCMEWSGPWSATLSRIAAINVPYQHPEGGCTGWPVNVSLPAAELEIVDHNRGNLARATYVRHILQQQVLRLDAKRGSMSRGEFVQKMLEESEE